MDASEYEGWFYEGGGLYRHTWLVKHAPVHSNCEQVELFLNGRSLGRKRVRAPHHLEWKEGSNTIIFGLVSNRGKAWGVFARGEEKL